MIYIFTHDSIGVGEDGPTHQPVEQLIVAARDSRTASRCGRATPTRSSRPGALVMQFRHEPVVLVLSRQNLPTFDRTKYARGVRAGERRLRAGRRSGRQAGRDPDRDRQRSVAVRRGLREADRAGDKGARGEHAVLGVVRDTNRKEYRDSVLPPSVTARVSVEQATTFGWDKYVGLNGKHRHAHVWRVRAAQGIAEEIWIHTGLRGCSGERRLGK